LREEHPNGKESPSPILSTPNRARKEATKGFQSLKSAGYLYFGTDTS